MSPHYGFELIGGREVTTDAATLAEAISQVEATSGGRVERGRCLDGFDNNDPAGIPDYILRHLSRPRVAAGNPAHSWP